MMKEKEYKMPAEEPQVIEEPFVMFGTLELDPSKRYTYADYLTWIDDKRRELIDGFIHLMSAPLSVHAQVSMELSVIFSNFLKKHNGKCRVFHAPFDVRLPLKGCREDHKIYDVVQPDVCVVCDLTKIDKRGCIGAPDLVVEVLSPSTLKYDWNYKYNLYEAAGVREYWIVDPSAKSVHVFLLQPDGKYNLGDTYESTDVAPVSVLQGLEIQVGELFE